MMSAQGLPLYPDHTGMEWLERFQLRTSLPLSSHTALRNYPRQEIWAFTRNLDTVSSLSRVDRANLNWLRNESDEWADSAYTISRRGLFSWLYPRRYHAFEANEPDFSLRVNPILHLQAGPMRGGTSYFFNQRGVDLRASLDHIYLGFTLMETQALFPTFIDRLYNPYRSLPGAHWVKTESYPEVLGFPYRYDWLNGRGVLGGRIGRFLQAETGFGNHRIGNGYRSLLLSDVATYYPYLKLNWNVWRIHLQNLYGQLSSASTNLTPDRLVARKYFAAHHLSVALLPGLQAGLFESIVFSRASGFEISYLNPVVLYRVVEGALGSPDNILLGGDLRWNLFKRLQLYGQFIFDEFRFFEVFVERRGWWGNKWGVQGGLKYLNVLGIKQLDFQGEVNIVRPYTYSQYRKDDISYTHHAQMLAHPLGANFQEIILRLQWQPVPPILLDARYFLARKGLDEGTQNYGGNPLADGNIRPGEYNHTIGQGLQTDIQLLAVDLRLTLSHQIFWDTGYFLRLERQANGNSLRDGYLRTGIRMNVGPWRTEY